MKQKYTVLGSGLLTIAFIAWLVAASMPAGAVVLVLSSMGINNSYLTLALLGLAELALILPLIIYMAVTGTGVRALLGNRTNWKQWLLAALVGVFMMPALQGINVAFSALFTWLGAEMPDTSMMEPRSLGSLFMGMAMIGVTAGVVEEPVFRGIVQRGFGSALGRKSAVLLTALVFAFVHMDIVGLPSRFIIGLVLGYMAWRSGSVIPGVFAHAAYNSTALGLSLLFTSTLAGWKGFPFLAGMPAAANEIVSWCLISLPFIALAMAAYRLYARATPKSAAWNDRPYARKSVKWPHILPWVGVGLASLAMTALTTAQMWMNQLMKLLQQMAGQIR